MMTALFSTTAFADKTDGEVTVSGQAGQTYPEVVDGKSPLNYTIYYLKTNDAYTQIKDGYVYVTEGTTIGENTSITIPNTVNISVIVKKSGVTKFEGVYAFKVVKIGDGTNPAFTKANASKLASITMGSNITTIANNAFNGDDVLTSITLNEGLTTIGDNAFQGVPLAALTLPSTLTAIGDNAFKAAGGKMGAYTAVTIPAAVTAIGTSAFEGNENLQTVTVSANSDLRTIGDGAFAWTMVKSLDLTSANHWYNGGTKKTEGMVAFGTDATAYGPFTSAAHPNNFMITEVKLPTTCVTVNEGAFAGLTNLNSLGDNNLKYVKTIGTNAFDGCAKLTSVAIATSQSAGITSIGLNAFANCAKLETVELGKISGDFVNAGAFGDGTAAADAVKWAVADKSLVTSGATIDDDITALYLQVTGETIVGDAGKVTASEKATYDAAVDALIAADAIKIPAVAAKAKAGVKTFKFNAITAALNTTAYNLPTVTTLYFQSFIATDDLVPANSFTNAFVTPVPDGVEYHVYYNVTPTGAAPYAKGINAGAFSADADAARIITVHTNNAIYDGANLINKATILGDFSGSVIIGTGDPKKLLKDKNSSYYYYYYKAPALMAINKVNENSAKVNVYQVYVDESDQTIYFMPLRSKDGEYVVAADQVVIIKSNKEDGVKATPTAHASTMAYDGAANPINDLKLLDADKSLLALQAEEFLDNGNKDLFFLKNPVSQGFGFAKFDMAVQTGGLKTNAVYLTCPALPVGAPMHEVWLDEEGNTTAIKTIETVENAANNGVMYNLQGIRVNGAAQKGIYIQNGKKFVVK